jgi:hypothetical protein
MAYSKYFSASQLFLVLLHFGRKQKWINISSITIETKKSSRIFWKKTEFLIFTCLPVILLNRPKNIQLSICLTVP